VCRYGTPDQIKKRRQRRKRRQKRAAEEAEERAVARRAGETLTFAEESAIEKFEEQDVEEYVNCGQHVEE